MEIQAVAVAYKRIAVLNYRLNVKEISFLRKPKGFYLHQKLQ